jgi:hypothetical protein
VEFKPQHCKLPAISSADAATMAAADLTHTLLQPAPATPFKLPGSERMQAIKELAAILEKMAPHDDNATKVLEPTPRVLNQHTPATPSPRVPTKNPTSPISTTNFPDMPCRIPRKHQPEIISQEERAYQLLESPLPRIEKAYVITDQITGQQLEYQHLLR